MSILEPFLPSHESRPPLTNKILGAIFLFLAVVGGLFFLFQALIPLVGYVESGAIVCGVLGVLGASLLFIHQKKKASPPEEIVQKVLADFKEIDIEKLLRNNVFSISLFSFGIGIVLSQLKDIKSLSGIYKILK